MSRESAVIQLEAGQVAEAKRLYLDTTDPKSLEEIARSFGRTIGWILYIARPGRRVADLIALCCPLHRTKGTTTPCTI